MRFAWAWCVLGLLVIALSGARAQTASSADPAPGAGRESHGVRREVARFDFEEGAFNPDPVPMFWFRAQDDPAAGRSRPGFPLYNEAAFDPTLGVSGTTSVRLPTQGGSTSLRLMPGMIPVFPDADYLVTAQIRTGGLRGARAVLVARVLDENREPIAGAEWSSEPVLSEGAWHEARIELRTKDRRATFLQLDLDLLQADRLGAPTGLAFADVTGSAWFDDVAVYLIPRVLFRTVSVGNVAAWDEEPTLEYWVRDLVAEPLTAELRVRDAAGNVVGSATRPIVADGRRQRWAPDLPAYGAYAAELSVLQDGQVIEEHTLGLVWASPARTSLGPMALLADRGAELLDPQVPGHVAGVVGSQQVVLSVADPRLQPALEALLQTQTTVTLAAPAGAGEIGSTLDRFGLRVRRWQVDPTLEGDLLGEIARLVPVPVVVSPARADEAAESAKPRLVGPGSLQSVQRRTERLLRLRVPASVMPDNVPAAAETWLERFGPAPKNGVILDIEPIDHEVFGARAAISDFVRRVIRAWSVRAALGPDAGPLTIGLPEPWRSVNADPGYIEPRPEVAALGMLNATLSGRRVVGDVELLPGVQSVLLAPDDEERAGGGVMVLWNESARPGAVVEAFLGRDTVLAWDASGNEIKVEPGTEPGFVRIPVSDEPVFVQPVDQHVVSLVRAVRLEPETVPAITARHEHEIVITNPFSQTLSGRVRVLSPGRAERWEVVPRTPVYFSAPPRGEARIPVSFSFPASQESGTVPIVVSLQLDSPLTTPPIPATASLSIGLLDLELEGDVALTPGPRGRDVTVNATITNRGARVRTLRLDATGTGVARKQYSISNLGPGESVVRTFVFPGAAGKLSGDKLRLSVVDVETPERLNVSVSVP